MGKVEMMLLQLNDDLLRNKVSQQVLLRHEQHRMKAAESGKKKLVQKGASGTGLWCF